MNKKLNLGCGADYKKGATNVDFFSSVADIRHDLNKFPYPFSDNEFDEIYCLNILEHLDDVIKAMEEIHRMGKNGCNVYIRVPHFRSACLYEDITHKKGFAWKTLDVFFDNSTIEGDYTSCRFKLQKQYYTHYKIKFLYNMLSQVPGLTDNLLSKFIPMASIYFMLEIRK